MAQVVKHTYQLKRGTSERWMELNPTLGPGEPGFETDTGQLKIGTGFLPWMALPYVGKTDIIPEEILEEVKKYIDENIAYSASENGGLKLVNNEFSIDTSMTLIIDCGGTE